MERAPNTASLMETTFLMSRVPDNEASSETVEIASLVQRTLEGDSAAFGQIMGRYERRVLTLAIRLLGVLDDAQDAAQEVFLRAFKYIHRLDLRKPVEPWLMQTTVNVCRDIGRKRQRRQKTFTEITRPDAVAADESRNPFNGFAEEQQRQMLWAALNRLPGKERMAVILRDVEGFSTSEVAAILRSSESTVRSQVSRARLRMREEIDRLTGGQQ